MIPRIRARSGQGDDGKWYFELTLWNFEGTMQTGDPFTFGPYNSEVEAKREMRRAVELAVKAVEPSAHGFIDLNNKGEYRPFGSEQ